MKPTSHPGTGRTFLIAGLAGAVLATALTRARPQAGTAPAAGVQRGAPAAPVAPRAAGAARMRTLVRQALTFVWSLLRQKPLNVGAASLPNALLDAAGPALVDLVAPLPTGSKKPQRNAGLVRGVLAIVAVAVVARASMRR